MNLKDQLKSWKVEAELPAHFQSDVWSRISARQESKLPTLSQIFERYLAPLCRPAPAFGLLTLSLLLGTGLGYLGASARQEENGKRLEARYVHSITPFK